MIHVAVDIGLRCALLASRLRRKLSNPVPYQKTSMGEPVIVWNTRHPLSGKTQEQFEQDAQRLLKGRVEAAYTFGSYGTKDFGQNSDVDVMLVVRTDKPFLDRALEYPDFIDLVPDMDLLVYTPEEFQVLTRDPSPGFWASAVASMKRIV